MQRSLVVLIILIE